MKNLIKQLFINEGFTSIDLNSKIFFTKDIIGISYYWLVVQVDSLSTVIDSQDIWFEDCKDNIKLKDFDKNTSLLVLTEIEHSIAWKKEVLLIEEDPFQFKKYVLGYTQDQLRELLSFSTIGEPEAIKNLITNETTFNDYKNSYSEYTWHNLLYTISQKLPFIKLNVTTEKGLDNLFEKLDKNLTKKEVLNDFNFIDERMTTDLMFGIEDLNFEELHSLITTGEE